MLNNDRFVKLSAGYEAEQKELSASVQKLTGWLAKEKNKAVNIDRFLAIVKKHLAFEELTPTILYTFISKIIVHSQDKSSGKRVQKIEIVYNFAGKIEIPETPAQNTAQLQVQAGKSQEKQRDSA